MTTLELVFMIIGFSVASYSIVGNDAIQTLGTFLAANEKRPWWVLWLFASGIMAAVLIYGWWAYDGDPAWERLDRYPMPEDFSWLYIVPPIALLILTRFGLPVSTTFLVLTVFAAKNLQDMLIKSLSGWVLAFVLGAIVYIAITKAVEKRFIDTIDDEPSTAWVVLQWASTAFLWAMWLIQDLANIYVYLPRKLSFTYLLASLLLMVGIQAYIFYTRGGSIQKIVTSKTNTQDIRAAAIINFLFGAVLLVFKEGYVMASIGWATTGVWPEELPKIPMSTTWVFLGLLAGRELGMNIHLKLRSAWDLAKVIGSDTLKATAGLVGSVIVALLLPVAFEAFHNVEKPAAATPPVGEEAAAEETPPASDEAPPGEASGAAPETSPEVPAEDADLDEGSPAE